MSVTPITFRDNGKEIELTIPATEGKFSGQPELYDYTIVVHGLDAVNKASLNGKRIKDFVYEEKERIFKYSFKRKPKDYTKLVLA